MSPLYLSPALEGVRLKLRRAIDHFIDLDIALGQILDDAQADTVGIGEEVQPNRQIVFRVEKQRPIDPRIALIVGDCIHNARTALDHIVYQLAILNQSDPSQITRINFPVCIKKPIFDDIARDKVAPFVGTKALAEIEKLQPYSTGNEANDLLWALHQLDIIDKHRLHIVARHKMRPVGVKLRVDNGRELDVVIPNDAPWKSTEDGAELLRFQPTGNYPVPVQVEVEVKTAIAIHIEQTGLSCDGSNLLVVLSKCIEHAGRIVDHFGRTFFGE